MPLRLSELLERIRPAGAPGAPSEGERQRRRDDRATEIAHVEQLLARFEQAAQARIDEAREEEVRVRRRAQARMSQIRTSLPDRLAVEAARASEHVDNGGRGEEDRIRAEAADEISRMTARADAEIPRLVDRVIRAIWSSTGSTDGSEPIS